MKDHMKDVADELMEAAEACVAEATPATLEPEKLTDPETRAAYWKHLYIESDQRNEKLERQIYVLTHERDEWRSKYEHTLAANVIPSWVSSPKPSDE